MYAYTDYIIDPMQLIIKLALLNFKEGYYLYISSNKIHFSKFNKTIFVFFDNDLSDLKNWYYPIDSACKFYLSNPELNFLFTLAIDGLKKIENLSKDNQDVLFIIEQLYNLIYCYIYPEKNNALYKPKIIKLYYGATGVFYLEDYNEMIIDINVKKKNDDKNKLIELSNSDLKDVYDNDFNIMLSKIWTKNRIDLIINNIKFLLNEPNLSKNLLIHVENILDEFDILSIDIIKKSIDVFELKENTL